MFRWVRKIGMKSLLQFLFSLLFLSLLLLPEFDRSFRYNLLALFFFLLLFSFNPFPHFTFLIAIRLSFVLVALTAFNPLFYNMDLGLPSPSAYVLFISLQYRDVSTCGMTYMSPKYIPIPVPSSNVSRRGQPYTLYLYREATFDTSDRLVR